MSTVPLANSRASSSSIFSGMNGSAQFRIQVNASLVRQGYSANNAAGLSLVYQNAYAYLQKNWGQVRSVYDKTDKINTAYGAYKGAQKIVQSTVLLNNAAKMGASDKILTGFSDARLAGAAGVLSGLVDVMQVVAQRNNVPINDCALSVAKVSLDLVGVVTELPTLEFGFTGVLFVMTLVSTASDGYELGTSCKLLK